MTDRSLALGPWGAVLGAIRKALAATTTTMAAEAMAAAMAAAWARLMAIKRCLMATDDL